MWNVGLVVSYRLIEIDRDENINFVTLLILQIEWSDYLGWLFDRYRDDDAVFTTNRMNTHWL